MTVQKMRDGKPYQEPFETSGEESFESGYEFGVNVSSPQPGFLYLINEGLEAGGAKTYVMLYPKPNTNGGSAELRAGETMSTGTTYFFDPNTGAEYFWIVWSAQPVPELEAAKGAVNNKDHGTIKDPGQASAIRQFLDKYGTLPKTLAKDAEGRRATVSVKGDVMANLLILKHH
jgi:hypothetical protein